MDLYRHGENIRWCLFTIRRLRNKSEALAWTVEPSRTDQEAFESVLAELCSASITSAKVRWSGKIQFSPGSTSRAPIGESGNNSGRAFFHSAKATLFAITRSLTYSPTFSEPLFSRLRHTRPQR